MPWAPRQALGWAGLAKPPTGFAEREKALRATPLGHNIDPGQSLFPGDYSTPRSAVIPMEGAENCLYPSPLPLHFPRRFWRGRQKDP